MQHASDDLLERYATQTLPEQVVEPLEQHLLICAECRERTQAEIDFVSAMCGAAKQIRESERSERVYTAADPG